MPIHAIEMNLFVKNTYEHCMIEFQMFGISCNSVAQAIIIGGFASLWNNCSESDRQYKFSFLTYGYQPQGQFPITKSSECAGMNKIWVQELDWSITTIGNISKTDKTELPEMFQVKEILKEHFGPAATMDTIVSLLVNKDYQATIWHDQN